MQVCGRDAALVSLWKVDDHSNADFMRSFYSQLRLTPNRSDALRNAQLAHRKVQSHPYFWAPFVLVGDPEPSSQKNPSARRTSMEEGWTDSTATLNAFST